MTFEDGLVHLTFLNLSAVLFIITILYGFGLTTYRIFFHPLRNFPGPVLAGATRWYEFYYDVVEDGQFLKHFETLHEIYGPIVRISPNHLHVNDPEFYHRVFNKKGNFTKAPEFYANLGIPDSLPTIIDPAKHKIHRAIVSPSFTPQSLIHIEPSISILLEKTCEVLRTCARENAVLNATTLIRCFTIDVVSMSVFGCSTRLLDPLDSRMIKAQILTDIDMFTEKIMFMKHFSFINTFALNLPEPLARLVTPGYISFRKWAEQEINKIESRREKGLKQTESGITTVFDHMLEDNVAKGFTVPGKESLVDAAFLLLLAGSDTTTAMMSWAMYYLATNRHCHEALRSELQAVPRTEEGYFEYKDLIALPYLAAFTDEVLRLRTGIPGPLPRIVPAGGIKFENWDIPGGSMVSISSRIIHDNRTIFPDPQRFDPSRFLGSDGRILAQKYQIAFSRGPRACVGIKFAYMQMYLAVATIADRFDFWPDEIYSDTKWRDKGVLTFDKDVYLRVTERVR